MSSGQSPAAAPGGVLGRGSALRASLRHEGGWWATGLGLLPLLIVGEAFAVGALGGALGSLAAPFTDITVTDDPPFVLNVLGAAIWLLIVLILPALFAGGLLLALLHRLAAKGWPERRLRRVAVIAGIVAGAPTLIFIPAGALYGLIVPLPGAGPAVRRRVLVRTALGVLGLLALLVPLSLVAPNG